MWRHHSFSEIQDSDQSISDVDEEHDRNWQENCVSLAGTSDQKKENQGVTSQLELLKDINNEINASACMKSHLLQIKEMEEVDKKDLCFSSEDEVEVPDFHKSNIGCKNNVGRGSIISKTDDSTCHPDECISGDEEERKMPFKSTSGGNNASEMLDLYTKRNKKQFEPCTSEVDTEARRLDQVTENARRSACCPIYSKDNTGSRSKTKRRSSSQIQPLKQGAFWSVWKEKDPNSSSDEDLLDENEVSEYPPMGKTSSIVLGGGGGETSKSSFVLPVEGALQYDHHSHSMAELLCNRQGKIRNLDLESKKNDRRKGLGQHSIVRNMSLSGKDIMSDEDPCEFMHEGSLTDNEDNAQISEHAKVKTERKTMADKFHEAFGCASVDDRRSSFIVPKHSRYSAGLFGRLQFVLQQQKEQDADFLKKVQNEVWPRDEARCIDVKVISRSFDSKLSVCHCSLLENEESSFQNPPQENFGKIWTVIFNSRVCGDVELEIGNLIRVHPPWKEVQVLQGGEIIILATYFSQIHT